jgi:hypothetical protein
MGLYPKAVLEYLALCRRVLARVTASRDLP